MQRPTLTRFAMAGTSSCVPLQSIGTPDGPARQSPRNPRNPIRNQVAPAISPSRVAISYIGVVSGESNGPDTLDCHPTHASSHTLLRQLLAQTQRFRVG